MTLQRRILVAWVVFLCVLAGCAAPTIAAFSARDSRRQDERRADADASRANQMSTPLLDQETGARGFILSAQPSLLDSYEQGRANASKLLKELGASQDPSLRRAVVELRSRMSQWQRTGVEPAIGEARATGRPVTLSPTQTVASRRALDAVHKSVATVQSTAQARVASLNSEIDDENQLIAALLSLTAAVTVLGLVFLALLLRRWITLPLRVFGGAVARVQAGDLDAAIPVTGPTDVAALARGVDGMRRTALEAVARAERRRAVVEEHAALVLALRAQLLTEMPPLPPHWSLAVRIRPAEGIVAGDCVDVVHLGNSRFGVTVIDISGDGPVTGILALRAKEVLHALLLGGASPGNALADLAQQLDQMGPETFLSAFVMIVDVRDGRVQYANAGHPPAFICSPTRFVELVPTGPIIGPVPGDWRTAETTMGPDENLVLYTDGVIEVRGPDGVEFGEDRLRALVTDAPCESADDIVRECLAEAERFGGGTLRDDATIVVVCRTDGQSDRISA